MKIKNCTTCGPQPVSAFARHPRSKDGLEWKCRPCKQAGQNKEKRSARQKAWALANPEKMKARHKRNYARHGETLRARSREWRKAHPWAKRELEWRQKYGITRADYNRMLAEQGGGCALCGATPDAQGGRETHRTVLYVDHDHTTGKVRGLLCNQHNRAIGLFGDDADLMRRAVVYLEKAKALKAA